MLGHFAPALSEAAVFPAANSCGLTFGLQCVLRVRDRGPARRTAGGGRLACPGTIAAAAAGVPIIA